MSEELAITLEVNGETRRAHVPVRRTLLEHLREDLSLTAAHPGCEVGQCGACTVLLDGDPVRACLVLAVQADGAAVETFERASDSGRVAALQESFLRHGALQCGYCTPGLLITAAALLDRDDPLTEDAIREALVGHVCRCTGYDPIVAAIADVAGARR